MAAERRWALGLALLLCLLPLGAARADLIVRGHDGQADLRLDYGRSLSRVALEGSPLKIRGKDLGPIEKARLDARRLLRASSLGTKAAVERIVRIVQQLMPGGAPQRYDAFTSSELDRHGEVRLSRFVKRRVGICRERAFLLVKMLREGGLKAHVKYGVLYDRTGKELGGHAWVETKIGGKLTRVDPSVADAVSVGIRKVPVTDILADGRERRVLGSRSRSWLYVPTSDLVVSRSPD